MKRPITVPKISGSIDYDPFRPGDISAAGRDRAGLSRRPRSFVVARCALVSKGLSKEMFQSRSDTNHANNRYRVLENLRVYFAIGKTPMKCDGRGRGRPTHDRRLKSTVPIVGGFSFGSDR